MNRAERIYKLHQLLKNPRPIPLKTLLDDLGASRATVVRDIGYMRDFMGAPIHYDRQANGYHYDRHQNEYELPGLWFNQSELHALLAVEQLLETVQPGLLSPALGPLKSRIRKLLSQSGHHRDTISARVQLQPVARRHTNERIFSAIASALLNEQIIEIGYHGRIKGNPSRRQIHPARLIHYRDNWYLAAWCESAADWRIFSLDRIETAQARNLPARQADQTDLNRLLGSQLRHLQRRSQTLGHTAIHPPHGPLGRRRTMAPRPDRPMAARPLRTASPLLRPPRIGHGYPQVRAGGGGTGAGRVTG